MRTISTCGIVSACLLVAASNATTASPNLFNKLLNCQGDCNKNSDCASGVCFKRDGFHAVPGCKGKGHSGKDYCTTQKPVNKAKDEKYEKARKAVAAAKVAAMKKQGCNTSGDIAALSKKLTIQENSIGKLHKAESKACPVSADHGWSKGDLDNWSDFAQVSKTIQHRGAYSTDNKTLACEAAKAKVIAVQNCTSALMD